MRMFVLFLLVLALGAGCTEEKSEFADLEREVSESPTNENITELLGAYAGWLESHPEPTEDRREVLQKSATLARKHLRYANQLNNLRTLMLEFPADTAQVTWAVEMANSLRKLRREKAAQVTSQAIAIRWPDDKTAQSVFASIPGDAPPVDSVIIGIGRSMFDPETRQLKRVAALEYVDACESYALILRNDQEAVDLLHKAAETCRSLGAIPRALSIYDWILEEHPDHPKTPQALFLKAFTYDSDLKEYDEARQLYQEFLEKYPDDTFAQSAEFLLENLGKDDEELLKTLEERAREEDTNEPS